MITYKSATARTVSIGRLQINNTTGITLDTTDETLEALVKEGFLVVEGKAEPLVITQAPKVTESPKPTEPK